MYSRNKGGNKMTYLQTAKGMKITKERAAKELEAHGLGSEMDQMVKDLGNKEIYKAIDVLKWLGY